MYLKYLIETLEKHDPAKKVPIGFGHPHSYRGYYHRLAFMPVENTTVGEMLTAAKSAIGTTYEGYKGGDYTIDEWTECHVAEYGQTGESLGPILLRYMLGDIVNDLNK